MSSSDAAGCILLLPHCLAVTERFLFIGQMYESARESEDLKMLE